MRAPDNSSLVSQSKQKDPIWNRVVMATDWRRMAAISLGIGVVFLNIFEIKLICKGKKRPFEKKFFSLSLSDLLLGLSKVMVESAMILNNANNNIHELEFPLYFCFFAISSLNLLLVTIDRIWNSYNPIHYHAHVYHMIHNIITVVAWVVPPVVTIFLTEYQEARATIHPEKHGNLIIMAMSYILVSVNIIYVVSFFCIVMLRRKGSIILKTVRQPKLQKKRFQLWWLTTITFLGCSLPFTVQYFRTEKLPPWWTMLIMLGAAIKPIIYLLQSKLFGAAGMIMMISRRRKSAKVQMPGTKFEIKTFETFETDSKTFVIDTKTFKNDNITFETENKTFDIDDKSFETDTKTFETENEAFETDSRTFEIGQENDGFDNGTPDVGLEVGSPMETKKPKSLKTAPTSHFQLELGLENDALEIEQHINEPDQEMDLSESQSSIDLSSQTDDVNK